jgi:DNA-binding transcriptional ArsR family regulator
MANDAFRALAHPLRRGVVERLALGPATVAEATRDFGVAKPTVTRHLRVLEEAGLVVTRRSGREKLHFLNPVPIRLIHDRWIDKYRVRQVSALAELKTELEETA